MAGFFDALSGLPQSSTDGLLSAAAALLQAGGPSRTPISFGQALGGGLQAFQQGVQGSQDRAYQQQLRDLQLEETRLTAEERKRKRDLEQQIQSAALASVRNPAQMALSAGGAPTVANAAAMQNMPSGGFDEQSFINRVNAIDPLRAMEFQRQFAKATPEFDTKINTLTGPDGRPVAVLVNKAGGIKTLENLTPREKTEFLNLGGREIAVNPFEVRSGQSFQRTMTPGEMASNAIAQANLGLSKERLDFDKLKEQRAIGAAPKMTEDQAKATGWLVQASQAYDNLSKVAFDRAGNITPAAKPGTADIIAGLPVMGGAGNMFRSADRQKFVQSASSLSESLLRAATGAGVNRDEAAQKVAELTPQFGDSEEVIRQKFDAIPAYIETLKVRAGPGANQATGILGRRPDQGQLGAPKNIPQGAANLLKMNPKLRDQFDEKYGAGAAASILGQ